MKSYQLKLDDAKMRQIKVMAAQKGISFKQLLLNGVDIMYDIEQRIADREAEKSAKQSEGHQEEREG